MTLLRTLWNRYRIHTTRGINTRLDTYQISALIDAGWNYRLPIRYRNSKGEK